MSLINDALKQARQTPPRPPAAWPPWPPADDQPASRRRWLWPAVIASVLIGAAGVADWYMYCSGDNEEKIIFQAPVTKHPRAARPPVAEVKSPELPPEPTPPPAPPPEPIQPVVLPILQGIFYSPTAPSAIVDGKTVRPGDQFRQYRVQEITKATVTLIGSDGQPVKIGMGD